MGTVSFVIRGKPATKKTGHRIVRNRKTGKPLLIRRKDTVEWTDWARFQIRQKYRGEPFAGPVRVTYSIYRFADRGDLGGYEAAIDDALEGLVVNNDAQITARHSRKYIDRQDPRVVVMVEAL